MTKINISDKRAALLQLTDELAQEIRGHGVRDYPNETLGALLGVERNGEREVRALFPLHSRRYDSSHNRFSIAPADFRAAARAAAQLGLEPIGWYHSHPDQPARPSEFDHEHAWPWYSYVIVSIVAGNPRELTSWQVADDRSHFDQQEIRTE